MRFWRRASGFPSKLAILSAAFHPPTRAHLALARAALDSGQADEVLFVLPAVLPHKTYEDVPLERRLDLVLAAIASEPRFSAAITERGLFHEIAAECLAEYPGLDDLAFLCGRDAAERIVGWDYGTGPLIEDQLRRFTLLVAPRGGPFVPPAGLEPRIRPLALDGDQEDVSATEVRRRISRGGDWHTLVPESIASSVATLYAPRVRPVGIIGGLGVAAGLHYYRELAAAYAQRGWRVDIAMVHAEQSRALAFVERGDLEGLAGYLAGIVGRLQAAGAELAVIPAVTPHLCWQPLSRITPLPLVNILEVTADAIRARGLRRVALFGTRFVIESRLCGALTDVEVVMPRPAEIEAIHEIYMHLVRAGHGSDAQRETLIGLARLLAERDGVEAIVLAGTDLAVLFNESNTPFPHVDCARIHLDAILDRCASELV